MHSKQEPPEDRVEGYKVSSDCGWTVVISGKVITSVVTPANFCNGEDHTFRVMAMNNCGHMGPASAPVVGNCGKCPPLVSPVLYQVLINVYKPLMII